MSSKLYTYVGPYLRTKSRARDFAGDFGLVWVAPGVWLPKTTPDLARTLELPWLGTAEPGEGAEEITEEQIFDERGWFLDHFGREAALLRGVCEWGVVTFFWASAEMGRGE